MKTKNKETDVDFIGGLGALTEVEEKALSEFFKKKKLLKPGTIPRPAPIKKKKENV